MTAANPTRIEEIRMLDTCNTCGAAPRQWCTVGQYGHPSPHRSSRNAQQLHSLRGMVMAEVYWMGYGDGEVDMADATARKWQTGQWTILTAIIRDPGRNTTEKVLHSADTVTTWLRARIPKSRGNTG